MLNTAFENLASTVSGVCRTQKASSFCRKLTTYPALSLSSFCRNLLKNWGNILGHCFHMSLEAVHCPRTCVCLQEKIFFRTKFCLSMMSNYFSNRYINPTRLFIMTSSCHFVTPCDVRSWAGSWRDCLTLTTWWRDDQSIVSNCWSLRHKLKRI